MKQHLFATLALVLPAALAVFSCAGAPSAPAKDAPGLPRPAASSSGSRAQAAPAAPSATTKASAPLPPPPVTTVAMAGAPNESVLAEARLTATSCEGEERIIQQRTEALVRQMRADVDAAYESWREAQPDCWSQFRINERIYRMRGASSWGYGGLGLSGIGEGGGGYGQGVGLGSVGTVGHGAGAVAKPAAARSASGTNNQVAGVDEADIVKNDGRYVYLAMNGALRIVEALRPRLLSLTKFSGEVRELFVHGDRAVVYVAHGGNGSPACTYGYDCQFAGDGSSTTVVVLDIADRTQPKTLRRIELSGSLMAARRIGDAVHTVVADGDSAPPQYSTWPDGLGMCGTVESAVRAKFKKLKAENELHLRGNARHRFPTLAENGNKLSLCEGLLKTPLDDGGAFTTVVSFDLTKNDAPATTASVQSRPGAVFASENALYLSVVHQRRAGGRWYSFYPAADEISDIHKFRIGERASDTRYLGSGAVPGHVLNQFAMDEWYGYLRVATSRGRVPDPKVESMVSVIAQAENGTLVRVGAVEKLAPGEDIRAVRFDGDRGYVVTFKKTDPLFVLDLSQPARPRVLGELKIPGFSTYMHRIDPDHLLSIGFDANDHGDFAYFDGVILQLFDVSKPTEPRLLHKEKIGTRGSSSEAATNHLAFNYMGERGLLAIPMTICEGGSDGVNGNELAFSGLLVYRVDVEGGFKRLGGVDHGTRGANCGTWWSNAKSQVKRSIFMDDLVYSIATDRLKVQRLGGFGTDVADLALLP